jgi:acyl-CoA reductase-like NAD-dependent aldehyde dehydrogenase
MGRIAQEARADEGNGAGDKAVRSWAPATGELLGAVPIASREEVTRTVERARRAQAAWSVLSVEERARRVLRLRDAVLDHAEEIADVVSRECGKPKVEALLHDVAVFLGTATHACKVATAALASREVTTALQPHRRAELHYVPRGVVGIISPWNFPFSIPMGDVVAALVTGSAVVVKPSDVAPLTMEKAKEIFNGCGLPEDLFQLVHGGADVGQALIESGIQKLVFTGGVSSGRKVAAACGAALVPCVMELGGKAPLVACSDCDLERTARAIAWGGFVNSGQACIAVERVYAHAAIHDALLAKVVDLVTELRQGDPARPDTDVGALTYPRQIDIAEAHIADATAKGAAIACGGKRGPGPGQFFEPTVLSGCTHEMTVMAEEIFGPIVPFMKVASDDEAIALANDSPLGLNAYVFTRDRDKGARLARRVAAGSVVVNDVMSNYAAAELPFGGIGQSGFGRVHGDDALRDMAQLRVVTVDRLTPPKRDPYWYPYGATTYKWMLRGLRAVYTPGGVLKRLGALF